MLNLKQLKIGSVVKIVSDKDKTPYVILSRTGTKVTIMCWVTFKMQYKDMSELEL